MGYNIYGTYGKPIIADQLNNAESMVDINADYPSNWINESDYISSEIAAYCNGIVKRSIGQNNIFTAEQRSILKEVDFGTTVEVTVKFIAKNSITHKDEINTMNFSVSLIPEKQAMYIGGEGEMKAYLKQYAIDRITAFDYDKFEMAKVKFVVNQEGVATDAEIINSSDYEEIDQLLLNTIANMPNWTPAESAEGDKVKQEFEFVVGTLIGC